MRACERISNLLEQYYNFARLYFAFWILYFSTCLCVSIFYAFAVVFIFQKDVKPFSIDIAFCIYLYRCTYVYISLLSKNSASQNSSYSDIVHSCIQNELDFIWTETRSLLMIKTSNVELVHGLKFTLAVFLKIDHCSKNVIFSEICIKVHKRNLRRRNVYCI